MNGEDAAIAVSEENQEWAYLHDRRCRVKLRALSNRLYQQDRARIMERREGIVKAASLVAGSIAFANVVDPLAVKIAAAVIFLGTALSLVLGWGNKARDAMKRANDWILLERDIEAAGERKFVEGQLDQWMARCNEIESGEPAANERRFELAFIRACTSLDQKPVDAKNRFKYHVALFIP